jgi:hypothetical protein
MAKRFEITFVPYANQKPGFQDQKVELTFQRYTNVPNWHSVLADGLVGRVPLPQAPTSDINSVDLVAFSNWHTGNSCNLFTGNITNAFIYGFDGTANSINDGGFDMYDSGNFISFSTTRETTNLLAGTNINYGTISNFPATNYGFYISQANSWPQISLAYTRSGTIQWRISGGIGTDNQVASSNSNVSGTYTTTNQGRNGSFWANQVYNTSDPSIVMTWFTILQPSLNSQITSSNDNRYNANPPIDPMNQNFTVTGTNFFFGCFLLSSRNTPISRGELIPTAQIQNFLTNYVQNAVLTIS